VRMMSGWCNVKLSRWCEQVDVVPLLIIVAGAADAEREARGNDDEDRKGKVSLFSQETSIDI
jgi:hypothetical protein